MITRHTSQTVHLRDYLLVIAVGGTAPLRKESPVFTSGSSTIAQFAAFYGTNRKKFTYETPIMSVNTIPVFSSQLPLFGPLAEGWELVRPITISVERGEDGRYLVSDDIFYMYGVGETIDEALVDYKTSLTEYYQIIEVRLEGKPENVRLFEKIRHFIRKIQ